MPRKNIIKEEVKEEPKIQEEVKTKEEPKIKEEVKTKKEFDTVSVPKEDWDKVMKTVQDQQSTIDMLVKVADKGRLAGFQEKHKDELIKKVSIFSIYDIEEEKDYAVVGWRMMKDEVGFDQNNRPYCTQILRMFLKDKEGSKKEKDVNYIDFTRMTKRITGEVVEEKKIGDSEVYIVSFEEFGNVDVPIQFLN